MMAEISLQEQVLNDLGKQMSQEIDNQVMCELLQESGWTLSTANKSHDYKEIITWVNNNATDHVHGYKYTWAFKSAKDATAFWLVWA